MPGGVDSSPFCKHNSIDPHTSEYRCLLRFLHPKGDFDYAGTWTCAAPVCYTVETSRYGGMDDEGTKHGIEGHRRQRE